MDNLISMTELELAMRKLANQVKLDTIEACAKIADPWPGFNVGQKITEPDLSVIAVRTDIAKAIRALAVTSHHQPTTGE